MGESQGQTLLAQGGGDRSLLCQDVLCDLVNQISVQVLQLGRGLMRSTALAMSLWGVHEGT